MQIQLVGKYDRTPSEKYVLQNNSSYMMESKPYLNHRYSRHIEISQNILTTTHVLLLLTSSIIEVYKHVHTPTMAFVKPSWAAPATLVVSAKDLVTSLRWLFWMTLRLKKQKDPFG